MYKINVINELTGIEKEYQQPDKQSKDAFLDKMVNREYWGKNQRWIEGDLPEELQNRVIQTFIIEATEDEPEKIRHEVKPDYVITETNLNLSKTYRNQKKIEARKSEYPSIEEVLHIILDHGLDSPEMIDIQNLRAAIKAKYPLE